LKIAFLISSLNAGGAERVVSLLANELSLTKDIVIITLSKGEPFYKLNDSITIKQLGVLNSGTNPLKSIVSNLVLIYKITSLIKSLRIKSLICFMTTSNILGIISGKFLSNINVTISERANPNFEDVGYWNFLRRKTYKLADRLVVQSEEISNYFKSIVDERKISIIPNPIKIVDSNKNKKEKIILTVGRVDANKNQEQIIKSFSRVKQEGWKLIICGDGSLLSKLKNLVIALNMNDAVEFKGIVKNIEKQYERASIFAFSSLSEGFPNVLLEAMNYGCACISTDCPTGPSMLIKNKVNGFLIPLADEVSYTNHLQKLIDDEKNRNIFVSNAKSGLEHYSLNKVAEQWIK
jgi:GalNAc-alpha-(1->4)-GalNAc-alpha-(1->3)-diNAcBac-PP-undecaprenol alpha-1,4-N-acetyl-D-galactosaminyltransferase|tara:strand:+ start:643 stop:1692 length:1050 start_codon:yes stop_codon:yes gene_type:complete